MKSWFGKLYLQVFIGIILGGLIGHFFPILEQRSSRLQTALSN